MFKVLKHFNRNFKWVRVYLGAGVNKSPSPTPGASNFHIWASWNNQLYARRASKNIYRILTNLSIFAYLLISYIPGADPGFQVRGGALKKIAPSGGRCENFWGISCEKSRFYDKESYFFQLRREARTFLGYFVWKITILRQKIIFLPILGGARVRCPPPWIRPCIHVCNMLFDQQQCFIYSTASFLSKLRSKKVEKLRILVIKQLQQTTTYRKFRKYRNRERLFPVLPIVKEFFFFFFFLNN